MLNPAAAGGGGDGAATSAVSSKMLNPAAAGGGGAATSAVSSGCDSSSESSEAKLGSSFSIAFFVLIVGSGLVLSARAHSRIETCRGSDAARTRGTGAPTAGVPLYGAADCRAGGRGRGVSAQSPSPFRGPSGRGVSAQSPSPFRGPPLTAGRGVSLGTIFEGRGVSEQ